MRAPDGRPVNAVRGLLDFVGQLVRQYSPTHLACAWDADWRPAWRVDLLPSYKAHRVLEGATDEESPDELTPQVPLIREALGALGIPVIEAAGFEADDVLASLAARFEGESLVVTGDRDLFQVVNERTRVVYLSRGIAKHDLVDQAWVVARYGIPAARYVDFAVLRGDPSDGLPGVKGIGDKSAAMLVDRFGGVDEIVAAAASADAGLAAGLRAKITESVDYLGAARRVVRAVPDLNLGLVPPYRADRIDRDQFDRLSAELGLGGSASRVLDALTS